MNERWRKLNANITQYVPFRASMGQHCSLSAVQRKTACVEQSWWPEFDMFGSMPQCLSPWHKLLARLAQKSGRTTVWIWSMSSHHYFRRRWLLQVCLGKTFPQNRATYFTQTPKKNKNEFWNCHLAMLGRVAKPIFTSLCPAQPLRVWLCEWITGFKKWNRLRAIGY